MSTVDATRADDTEPQEFVKFPCDDPELPPDWDDDDTDPDLPPIDASEEAVRYLSLILGDTTQALCVLSAIKSGKLPHVAWMAPL